MTVHPTLYVSGPVTGVAGDNLPAFADARRRLRSVGYAARIPHEDVRPGTSWEAAMRTSLMAILAQADGLAMLDGWERSRGARAEHAMAVTLGMPVAEVGEWVRAAARGGRENAKYREKSR